MNVLLMINNLPMGGAETFLVRLALGLKQRGHTVVVSIPKRRFDASLAARLRGAQIPLRIPWWSRSGIYRVLFKLGTLFPKGDSATTLIDSLHSRFLRGLHRQYRFDVVNPHMTWAERRACLAFKDQPISIVSTDHGDYRWNWSEEELDAKKVTFARLDALICPSNDNLRVANRYPWSARCRRGVIYYGYEQPTIDNPELAEGSRPLNFCMVARGAEETKGWDTAVEAFRMVRRRHPGKVSLTLVGAGAALDFAVARFDPDELRDVTLSGYQSDPSAIVASADVGLLPTRFPGESLPLVIIEFLGAGKPVLATNVAGIPEMLRTNSDTAGELLPLAPDGKVAPARLAETMDLYLTPSHLQHRSRLAKEAAQKFDMSRCLDLYERVFRTGDFSGPD